MTRVIGSVPTTRAESSTAALMRLIVLSTAMTSSVQIAVTAILYNGGSISGGTGTDCRDVLDGRSDGDRKNERLCGILRSRKAIYLDRLGFYHERLGLRVNELVGGDAEILDKRDKLYASLCGTGTKLAGNLTNRYR